MITRILCTAGFVVSTFGAGFTAQADCYVNSGNPAYIRADHGTLSCFAGPAPTPNGPTSAVVNNTVFVTDTSAGADSFSLIVDKFMQATEGIGARGAFVSSINFQQTLTSEGPVRQGMVAYSLYPGPLGNAGDFAFDYQVWSLGPYSGQSTGRGSQGVQGSGFFLVPFLLGSPFNVRMSSLAYDDFDASSVGGRSSLEFRLFETDGVTLVRIVDTPEPGMTLYTGLSAVAIVLSRRLRRPSN